MNHALGALRRLDAVLRGERGGPALAETHRTDLPLVVFTPLGVILGGVYGAFMGLYLVRLRGLDGLAQVLSAGLKLPLLFFLTLLVTFPSLYVFGALLGSRLTFTAMLRVMVAAVAVNLAVAASLAPILGFFTLSTDSYSFMVLLNVVLLGISGAIGLGFLIRTLNALARGLAPAASRTPEPPPAPPIVDEESGVRRLTPPSVRPAEAPDGGGGFLLAIWAAVYGLVGLQMGWILRPFIGHPNAPFEIFRKQHGTVFTGIFGALSRLMGIE